MDSKNLLDFTSIVSFVIVLIFLFFACFLLTVPTANKTRNRLLASFLIITAIDISVFFYYRYITLPPTIEMLRVTCIAFLKWPILYLYVRSLIYTNFQLQPKHLIHTLPFWFAVALLLPHFFLASQTAQAYYFHHLNEMTEIKFLAVILHLQSFCYIVSSILLLRKYKTLLFENYASNISFSNYKWVSQLITVIITLNCITEAKDFLKNTDQTNLLTLLTIIMLVGGLGFIFWVILNALYHPNLFRGIDAHLQPVQKLVAETTNPASQNTSDNNTDTIRQLKQYMSTAAPYLEPNLTIQDLASQINMPVRDLSILINHTIGQHFFDYINNYRIEKAMQLLRDPSKKEVTVLEILYEVGFNSKSSFHTAFKKHTTLTPTQYRKTHLL